MIASTSACSICIHRPIASAIWAGGRNRSPMSAAGTRSSRAAMAPSGCCGPVSRTSDMLDLYVDGDACPVKAEIERVAERHGLKVIIVSNGGLRPSRNPLVQHVTVAAGADAADDWIAEHAGEGDIVVTADVPLASRVLKTGAHAIG